MLCYFLLSRLRLVSWSIETFTWASKMLLEGQVLSLEQMIERCGHSLMGGMAG